MSSTKIINILKEDSFEEIFEIFKDTPAQEVIFVLPKKSKALSKEEHFATLHDLAEKEGKSISLLCSNSEINQLAKKYNFDVLLAKKDSKGGDAPLISAVTQVDDNKKPTPRAAPKSRIPEKTEEKQPEEPELPGFPVAAEVKPEKPKTRAVLEDIIRSDDAESKNVKVAGKKEKPVDVSVKKEFPSDIGQREAVGSIEQVWEAQKESFDKQLSPNIWQKRYDESINAVSDSGGLSEKLSSIWHKFFSIVSKKIAFALVGVAVVLLLAVIYISSGSAKIILAPAKQALNLQMQISASDKISEIDFDFNKIPGQLFEIEKTASRSFPATGSKDAIQKARGMITVYNESSAAQIMIATTRFESSEIPSLIFRTLKFISVPPARKVGGQIEPGKVTVEVIADKAGQTYNIPAGSFIVPAFREHGDSEKYTKIYGKSSEPMHGGIAGKATIVAESDYTAAKESLEAQIKSEINGALSYQTAGLKIINPTEISFTAPVSSAGVDDAAENFAMSVSGKIKVMGFKESDLYGLIGRYVEEKSLENGKAAVVNPEKILLNFDKIKFSEITVSGDTAENIMEFTVGVAGNAYTKLDYDKIVSDLRGKNKMQIAEYLKGVSDLETARVILAPFWVNKVPKDKDSVTYEIVY